MATIDNTNWEYEKPVEGDSQAQSPNGAKVQPVFLDGSLAEGSTGNGNIGYDTSRIDTTDVNTKLQSIVFTEPDGSTTKPYEVENPEDLGTANEVVVWIYDQNWATDDTVAFNFYVGSGDGTDYSSAGDGSNPRTQTGITQEHAYTLDTNANVLDKVGTYDATNIVGTIEKNIEFDGGLSFDGTDDEIAYGVYPENYTSGEFMIKTVISDISGTSTEDPVTIWDEGSGGSESFAGIRINFNNSGRVYLAERDSTGSGFELVDSGVTVNDGNVYLVYGVIDIANSEARIYVDGGTVDGSLSDPSISNGFTFNTQGSTLNFGGGLIGPYSGDIDDTQIHGAFPGEEWIQADFDASPKGGQIFFNANQGSTTTQPTDQVGSVKQTNSSGVVQTTADGVIKTEP